MHTCSPSWTPLPPPSLYHPSRSSQCTSPKHPVSCIKPGLAIHFLYEIIHVSMPFSQIIPPSPSPKESKRLVYTSVSLLLSCIQGYRYHLSKFHIYALVYCIGGEGNGNPLQYSCLENPMDGSLIGCSAWGREESDTTEGLHFHFSFSCTGEGNGNPLQCSCLENPRDGRAIDWRAAVYGFAQSRTRLTELNWTDWLIQGYCYRLSIFHVYVLVYCIDVFLSGLLHSV